MSADAINAKIQPIFCEGCGEEMLFSPGLHDVCWSCVKARHRAAMTHRCSCGKKKRPVIVKQGGRDVTKCRRCLGAVTK